MGEMRIIANVIILENCIKAHNHISRCRKSMQAEVESTASQSQSHSHTVTVTVTQLHSYYSFPLTLRAGNTITQLQSQSYGQAQPHSLSP